MISLDSHLNLLAPSCGYQGMVLWLFRRPQRRSSPSWASTTPRTRGMCGGRCGRTGTPATMQLQTRLAAASFGTTADALLAPGRCHAAFPLSEDPLECAGWASVLPLSTASISQETVTVEMLLTHAVDQPGAVQSLPLLRRDLPFLCEQCTGSVHTHSLQGMFPAVVSE